MSKTVHVNVDTCALRVFAARFEIRGRDPHGFPDPRNKKDRHLTVAID